MSYQCVGQSLGSLAHRQYSAISRFDSLQSLLDLYDVLDPNKALKLFFAGEICGRALVDVLPSLHDFVGKQLDQLVDKSVVIGLRVDGLKLIVLLAVSRTVQDHFI